MIGVTICSYNSLSRLAVVVVVVVVVVVFVASFRRLPKQPTHPPPPPHTARCLAFLLLLSTNHVNFVFPNHLPACLLAREPLHEKDSDHAHDEQAKLFDRC